MGQVGGQIRAAPLGCYGAGARTQGAPPPWLSRGLGTLGLELWSSVSVAHSLG